MTITKLKASSFLKKTIYSGVFFLLMFSIISRPVFLNAEKSVTNLFSLPDEPTVNEKNDTVARDVKPEAEATINLQKTIYSSEDSSDSLIEKEKRIKIPDTNLTDENINEVKMGFEDTPKPPEIKNIITNYDIRSFDFEINNFLTTSASFLFSSANDSFDYSLFSEIENIEHVTTTDGIKLPNSDRFRSGLIFEFSKNLKKGRLNTKILYSFKREGHYKAAATNLFSKGRAISADIGGYINQKAFTIDFSQKVLHGFSALGAENGYLDLFQSESALSFLTRFSANSKIEALSGYTFTGFSEKEFLENTSKIRNNFHDFYIKGTYISELARRFQIRAGLVLKTHLTATDKRQIYLFPDTAFRLKNLFFAGINAYIETGVSGRLIRPDFITSYVNSRYTAPKYPDLYSGYYNFFINFEGHHSDLLYFKVYPAIRYYVHYNAPAVLGAFPSVNSKLTDASILPGANPEDLKGTFFLSSDAGLNVNEILKLDTALEVSQIISQNRRIFSDTPLLKQKSSLKLFFPDIKLNFYTSLNTYIKNKIYTAALSGSSYTLNTYALKNQVILNLGFKKKFGENLNFSFHIQNILDEQIEIIPYFNEMRRMFRFAIHLKI